MSPLLYLAVVMVGGIDPNLVRANNQFVTIGSPLELSCNVSGISQHDIDMYHIANQTAHNVTNKRTDKSVIAEFGSVTRQDNSGWYCCCQGNCLNGSIGNVLVFVGERPKNDVNMECLIRSDNTIFCTWTSDDDCILWRVFYLSKSTNKPLECNDESTSCKNCPSSWCYIRSATTGASLCRQCTISLPEDVEVNENFSLQFHGENLWGNTQFNKSIIVEEGIVHLGPVLNVTVDKTSVYSAIISWTIPVVPKPFDRTANITCSVETVSDKNVIQKSMIIVQRSSNATMTINSLSPITNYTVTVQCKLTNARYWSQKVTSVLFNTESARPLAGPELEKNCYIVKKHSVLVYFKKIDWSIARGVITGYHVILNTSSNTTTYDYSADSLTVEIPVDIDTDYIDVEMYSRNEEGLSIKPSYLHIAKPVLNLNNESPITLAVEKNKHGNFAWLSVYKYNALDTVKDVSTIYWCRGIVDNTGEAVICKSDFYYTPYVGDLRIEVDEVQDESWHFAVAYGNQASGLVWESCVFNCRSCDQTPIPMDPSFIIDWNGPLMLNLTLHNGFCQEHQWLPFRYFIKYFPLEDPSLAINKTIVITPYLKTIILDHIEEHKTYQISIQMASRTLNYGPPVTFNVPTNRPNRGKGSSLQDTTELSVIIVPVVVSLVILVFIVLWYIRSRYKRYVPDIITPEIRTSVTNQPLTQRHTCVHKQTYIQTESFM